MSTQRPLPARLLAPSVTLQREYYQRTAADYDRMHPIEPQHRLALHMMLGACRMLDVQTILEVGCGSGRVLNEIGNFDSRLHRIGVEPSAALLGHAKQTPGSGAQLLVADGNHLPFVDGAVDIACAFAVLHHVPRPKQVLLEMLRVARVGVFVSDSNNFGQGGAIARRAKRMLNALGLWRVADWIRTGGKGWHYSDGDGVFYSFSLFTHLHWISQFADVHLVNLDGGAQHAHAQAGTVGMLAIKRN